MWRGVLTNIRGYKRANGPVWRKPCGGEVYVYNGQLYPGVRVVKNVVAGVSCSHVIFICQKLSFSAIKYLNAKKMNWEILQPDIVNILEHSDVPTYRKITNEAAIVKLYGPVKFYRKLLATEDPVCLLLNMKKREIWLAKFNTEGIGTVEEPRLIV